MDKFTSHRIGRWLRKSSPSNWQSGMNWYTEAHDIAGYIGRKYGLLPMQVQAVTWLAYRETVYPAGKVPDVAVP